MKKKTGDGALVEQYTDLLTSKLSKAKPSRCVHNADYSIKNAMPLQNLNRLFMNFIACQSCHKKLLKIANFDRLQVKCPRCKAINNYQAILSQNPLNAISVLPEVHETPKNGETCGEIQSTQ
ncbi:Com family DNA-binding transcriptional regulator [Moraxella caprae]|uniref:Com family DNA-binding transcriptional regulator n=1 Tax=Moraxella caprae TaxID=90240 RepID=UPI00142EA1F9|nr:Com family DNA-binding transcriptional regulator [Moraxella caprae]